MLSWLRTRLNLLLGHVSAANLVIHPRIWSRARYLGVCVGHASYDAIRLENGGELLRRQATKGYGLTTTLEIAQHCLTLI